MRTAGTAAEMKHCGSGQNSRSGMKKQKSCWIRIWIRWGWTSPTTATMAEKLDVLKEAYEREWKAEKKRLKEERQQMLDEIRLENQTVEAGELEPFSPGGRRTAPG